MNILHNFDDAATERGLQRLELNKRGLTYAHRGNRKQNVYSLFAVVTIHPYIIDFQRYILFIPCR